MSNFLCGQIVTTWGEMLYPQLQECVLIKTQFFSLGAMTSLPHNMYPGGYTVMTNAKKHFDNFQTKPKE
jgi:hypothetical protein